MFRKKEFLFTAALTTCCVLCAGFSLALAQEPVSPIELRGDTMEYAVDGNKMTAEGNVVVSKDDTKLTCDKIVYYQDTKAVEAEGNVILRYKTSTIYADKLSFNFENMTGEFIGGKIIADPYYGYGQRIAKIGKNHMQIEGGHISTCDLDKPHYEIKSQKIDVYPGEKAVARNVRFLIGKLPLLYIPHYTKDLRDQRQKIVFTPGYDKDWGAFLLQRWRYYFSENFKGTVHLDYRELKDFAWGIDLDYKTKNMGKGIVRTYYMNERNITSDRFWQERPSPTIERERFKVEWRHQWIIDNNTEMIGQYYKLSDSTFLKDYFEREYERDSTPDTFFQFTHALSAGIFSFRTDVRVNRFESKVERLPELQYTLVNQPIGNTGLFFKTINTYSNLTSKLASPSEDRKETMRLDSESTVSYPFKLGFVEIKPYVGGRNTYYSKTKDSNDYNVVRGLFETGADLSTKFYKIFDVQGKFLGGDINRLRHIITPSIAYRFTTDPTIPSSKLDSFDDVDSLTQQHTIKLSLENKLQTKREKQNVDLLRAVVSTDFRLKEHSESAGGFDHVTADFELKPVSGLSFYWDADYDTQSDHLESSNFDFYVNPSDRWFLNFSKRYSKDVDDQITTEFQYIINPKWKFRNYYRFDVDGGSMKEQEYTLTRDLHCWEMDISFNQTKGEGNEIWLVFRLKAFPEIGFDFGTSFNKRKTGSQGD